MDTFQTRAQLVTSLADNSIHNITPQMLRNWLFSSPVFTADGVLQCILIPRTDIAANYTSLVLAQGELAYVTDTGMVLVGDGATAGGIPVTPSYLEVTNTGFFFSTLPSKADRVVIILHFTTSGAASSGSFNIPNPDHIGQRFSLIITTTSTAWTVNAAAGTNALSLYRKPSSAVTTMHSDSVFVATGSTFYVVNFIAVSTGAWLIESTSLSDTQLDAWNANEP